MKISIILVIALLLFALIVMLLLYLLTTKNLSKDIEEDLNTLTKSMPKNSRRKSVTRNKLRTLDDQMSIIRTSLYKFDNRIYLSKKHKKNKEIYKNKMLEIELIYTRIRLK